MKYQRGVIAVIWLYLLAAGAVVGGLYGIYAWIDHTLETSAGIVRGKEIKQAEWADANRQAQKKAADERVERDRIAAQQSKQLAIAQDRARDADARWRAARTAAARAGVPLVVENCDAPLRTVPESASSAGAGLRLATSLRFTAQFVREYDSAWTDQAGQPVFSDSSGSAQAPGTASTVGPDDILIVHAENASRCSANARRMNALIDLIEKLRAR